MTFLGIAKERDVFKYVTDPKVDKMIWDWYCLQQNKPSSKEVNMLLIFYIFNYDKYL